MTGKIGVSLQGDLYEWGAREVAEGRAKSVSALIAHGLEVLRSRSELAELVRDLKAEIGELNEETKTRVDEAMRAAEEAQRRHRGKRRGSGDGDVLGERHRSADRRVPDTVGIKAVVRHEYGEEMIIQFFS
jgi:hypothetical protein